MSTISVYEILKQVPRTAEAEARTIATSLAHVDEVATKTDIKGVAAKGDIKNLGIKLEIKLKDLGIKIKKSGNCIINS